MKKQRTLAEEALASFPLPDTLKTSQENYSAILKWLYNSHINLEWRSAAEIIIRGRKEPTP